MITQINRENVIKALDKEDSDITLKDLFVYDLSPYYKEKYDESFFSKQLEFMEDKRMALHDNRISFTPAQVSVYNRLKDKECNRVLLSAPTSFGKTMLVKEYIFTERPSTVVFIVPTNSLADELIYDFSTLFQQLGYFVFDTIKLGYSLKEKSIFIGTQEKFYSISNLYKSKGIDLFVIDEAYKLSDQINTSREVILNRVFIDSFNLSSKIILLLPLVNDIKGLSSFDVLKSDYSPVAKEFIPSKDLNKTILEKIKEEEESNLVYFCSPKEVDSFFIEHIYKNESINNNLAMDKWIKQVGEDFHPEWIPLLALKKGIGIHYGPIPKFIQKKVIELFTSSSIKTILATSSVIEGVNTPTKNIFITTSKEILGTNHLIKFKNLIGRAGRLGVHKVGHIYYKREHKIKLEEANKPYEDINLKFVIDDEEERVAINREKEYNMIFGGHQEFRLEESSNIKTHEALARINFYHIPLKEIDLLLDKHGYTIIKLIEIIEFLETREKKSLYGILYKLNRYGLKELKSLNIILDLQYNSIVDIVDRLKKQNCFSESPIITLVPLVIRMIYNTIPYIIIPAINFIIELDALYQKFNLKHILPRQILDEAITKKNLFMFKFLGSNSLTDENARRVMTKLFEYGIPYQKSKKYIDKITQSLPGNFSIYDLKKIIDSDRAMEELSAYLG